MVKRTIPKRFQQLVKRLEHGSLASIANPSRPHLSIRTYYPGCLISLSILNNEWCIDVKNRDPDKISNKLKYLMIYCDRFRLTGIELIQTFRLISRASQCVWKTGVTYTWAALQN